MASRRTQKPVDSFAVLVTLCLSRALRNRTLLIACAFSIILFYWTAVHHRVTVDGPHTLCVAVFSAPTTGSLNRRQVARDTWLSLEDGVKHYFFVGSESLSPRDVYALESESREFGGDLVILPFVDSYKNLTLKLLYSTKYLVERCDCKYILKADDDTFARVDLIVSELEVVKVEQLLYWGYFTGKAPVFHRGKWAEPDWFLCDKYLPYARGGGYVFSQRVAKYIADNSQILQRYVSEDVSFGAWTAGLQLHRVHDPRFDTEYLSRGCLNSYLVTHKQSIDDMLTKMKNIRDRGKLCPEDEHRETRRSYTYNWTVLPSHCCEPT